MSSSKDVANALHGFYVFTWLVGVRGQQYMSTEFIEERDSCSRALEDVNKDHS